MNVYILGPLDDSADDQFAETCTRLRAAGHTHWIIPPIPDMRVEIRQLLDADAICLVDGWWSESICMMLQTLAAWLKLKVVDTDGKVLPTKSLRG